MCRSDAAGSRDCRPGRCAVPRALTGAPPAGGEPSAEELAKQLANPVASLVSVPFQSNWEFGVEPDRRRATS